MIDRPGTAFVVRPGEGRSIDLGNFEMSLKATDEETGSAFTRGSAVTRP